MVIDVYSRYLTARPLTNRNTRTIIDNVKNIFEEMGQPETITCDNEFNTRLFQQFFINKDIKVIYTDPYEINKNAIVERANGTIARLLQKIRVATENNRWFEYLNDAVYNYNHTYHSTIKAIPYNVFNGIDTNKQELIRIKPNIKVGDLVRLKIRRELFDKGDMETYSREVYRIIRKVGNKYKIQDIEDGEDIINLFKDYELKRINEIVENRPVNNQQLNDIIEARRQRRVDRALNRDNIRNNDVLQNRRNRRPARRDPNFVY